MTPSTHALFALRLVVGIQGQAQFGQVFRRMPKIKNALGQREVLAKEFFEAIAAVRERDLLFGLIPTDLRSLTAELRAQFVELVKAR
jgi:hypothetical protein